MGNAQVIMGVRNLLRLIPTDSRVLQALEAFGPQSGGGASEDSQENVTPKTVLEKYFSTSETTPTQLLYNLEVCTCYL